MGIHLSSEQYTDIICAIDYIRDVFPADELFDKLVKGGPVELYNYDSHGLNTLNEFTIQGDDLAGACYHLNILIQIFGIENAVKFSTAAESAEI
jgi:hypothetical protein